MMPVANPYHSANQASHDFGLHILTSIGSFIDLWNGE